MEKKHIYYVWIVCDTEAQAEQVMAERLCHDEVLEDEDGVEFDYTIQYEHEDEWATTRSRTTRSTPGYLEEEALLLGLDDPKSHGYGDRLLAAGDQRRKETKEGDE